MQVINIDLSNGFLRKQYSLGRKEEAIMVSIVKARLENCYGIRSLNHTFDVSDGTPVIVYAPNGMMKSSFARTFSNLSQDETPFDRVYHNRETLAEVTDENGDTLSGDSIFVIEPYDRDFRSKKISTLLVNAKLKSEYENIYEGIDNKLSDLLNSLKKSSGIRVDLEAKFTSDFSVPKNDILKALGRLQREVSQGVNPDYQDFQYKTIFNDKVEKFLGTEDFKSRIQEYTSVYDQLISSSKYFRKGIFNHNNASVIAKNLKQNGWFDSGHSVTMHSTSEAQSIELKTEEELEQIVQEEKDQILSNPDLNESFERLDNALKANIELRDFREFLISNKAVIPELGNVETFKQNLWIAYLNSYTPSYEALMNEWDSGKNRIEEIVNQAKQETTRWLRVIEIFNERFSVPFRVKLVNQDDVILRSEAPNIKFDFVEEEGSETVPIEEEKLYEVLSNGEKRALYILNIIFEVEARREASQETLFIVDDIADSFDYKNKYAIIEYLKDITKDELFNSIILSHNFDFFRAACSRLGSKRENRLHAVRIHNSIRLEEERYQNSPFNHWRSNLDQPVMMIASIPFVRNLAEFCGNNDDKDALTSVLHIKNETKQLAVQDIEKIFKNILSVDVNLSCHGENNKILDLIMAECRAICQETEESIQLEKKIVLAIGIRLRAEQAMIRDINDAEFVNSITQNQTYELSKKFVEKCPDDLNKIALFESVNIMTPENIHLNSFMYEPILDMSNHALRHLFTKVDAL